MRGFGGGSGDVHFDDTQCSGSELRLEDCEHSRIDIDDRNCYKKNHVDDAGVICFSGEFGRIIILVNL